VFIVALSGCGCSGGGKRDGARAGAGSSPAPTAAPGVSTTKPNPAGVSTTKPNPAGVSTTKPNPAGVSTTKPTLAPSRTSSTVTPGQTTPGAGSRNGINGDWKMSISHPSYDALYQALVATRETIAVAGGRYTVTAKTQATILGSRCAPLPAGAVIATFAKTAHDAYSGEYKIFNTRTCAFYSSASLIVMVPSFAHTGAEYAFYGVPQYAGVFVKA
jgi:hypothetical protein